MAQESAAPAADAGTDASGWRSSLSAEQKKDPFFMSEEEAAEAGSKLMSGEISEEDEPADDAAPPAPPAEAKGAPEVPPPPAEAKKPAEPEWMQVMQAMQRAADERFERLIEAMNAGRQSTEAPKPEKPAEPEWDDIPAQMREFAKYKLGEHASEHDIEEFAATLREATAYNEFADKWDSPEAKRAIEERKAKLRATGKERKALTEQASRIAALEKQIEEMRSAPERTAKRTQSISDLSSLLLPPQPDWTGNVSDDFLTKKMPTLATAAREHKAHSEITEYVIDSLDGDGVKNDGSREYGSRFWGEMGVLNQRLQYPIQALQAASPETRDSVVAGIKAMSYKDTGFNKIVDRIAATLNTAPPAAVQPPQPKSGRGIKAPSITARDVSGGPSRDNGDEIKRNFFSSGADVGEQFERFMKKRQEQEKQGN